jgi:PAS domain S-box-containing protein
LSGSTRGEWDARCVALSPTLPEAIVRQTDAALARIWTVRKNEDVLELQASAGMYTHLDGAHSRVPVGDLKIGLIAREKKPHLTNDVVSDPRISDEDWAKSEGVVAFAGYPLIVEDRVVGVMAMFSRQLLLPTSLEALASIADSIAQGIERKQAEGALRHSEAFLAEAQRLSHTGSIGWNPSSGSVYWSEETFRIAELEPTTKLTTTLLEQKRVHPEDLPQVQEAFALVRRNRTDLDLEHRLLMPDGSIKHVRVVAHPVKGESGELNYVGTLMDISERKRAEAVLRATERELRQLIDVVPQFMGVYGADYSPLYFNNGLLEYLGFSVEGLRADELRARMCHPDDLERMNSVREQAIRRGESWEVEARILRRDGQYRWFLIRVRPFRDEEGRIVRWYSSGTDIEDLKRAEEALRASEQFSRLIVESIPDFACTMTAEGEVEFVNQRILDYTGWTLEELRSWAPLLHKDDVELVLTSWKHSVTTGDPFDLEERIRGADGSYHWFHARGLPRRDAEGRITRWYLLLTDIEDLKRAEEALQQAQVELAHVTRVSTLGELAASIAHEINQPLAGIVANGSASLRWLAGDSPNLEEARDATRRMIRDAKRASDVIARIRALSRKTDIQKERMDINEAIQEVLTLVQGRLRRNRVVLKSELAGDLPHVLGDRVQLQQVVLNLIMNAVEAMNAIADRPRYLIMRTEDSGEDQVHVIVTDSGLGLDPQKAERIFDAFYTTKPGGLGMGLSISRSIVESHGGRLSAAPNDGHGAVFKFTLLKYR